MHLLGIGTKIEVSGHEAKVTGIRSVRVNPLTKEREAIVDAVMVNGRRVSVLGSDVERALDI